MDEREGITEPVGVEVLSIENENYEIIEKRTGLAGIEYLVQHLTTGKHCVILDVYGDIPGEWQTPIIGSPYTSYEEAKNLFDEGGEMDRRIQEGVNGH